MAKTNYIGQNGLIYLITLIKNTFVKKVLKTGSETEYKVLSDNDLTNELKANYDAAYTHSTVSHAPSNAQENIIENVKVNGSVMSISEKSVDISVPIVSTDISADKESYTNAASTKAVADYVTDALSKITGISFRILQDGEYDANGFPTVTGEDGVIYLVPTTSSETDNSYNEFIYVNGTFEKIGTTSVDLTGYLKETDIEEFTNSEIDEIWTSVT